jgi:hypothetical protein
MKLPSFYDTRMFITVFTSLLLLARLFLRESAVSTTTTLWDVKPGSIPCRTGFFFVTTSNGYRDPFPGFKWLGREAIHRTVTPVVNAWSYSSMPPYVCIERRLIKHHENLIFPVRSPEGQAHTHTDSTVLMNAAAETCNFRCGSAICNTKSCSQ